MLQNIALALLGLMLSTPVSAQMQLTRNEAVPAATSQSAREVLDRVRPSLIQIKGFFGSNTAQAFHGTGFAVAPGGRFMTNYHVVSEQVQHPGKYRLEYRTAEGKTGSVKVLAVDVRNDLALVQAEDYAPAPIVISARPTQKGDRTYAVGYPLDVGLTITEGVSNGKVEDAFEARIHYSGALNAGMSGGPALNAAGEVIGVNVSGYRFQQLVSFLVPAEQASALIDRVGTENNAPPELKKDIVAQLKAHSSKLLSALDGPIKTQVSSGYALPDKLAPFIDCNASGDTATNQPVQMVRVSCSAKAGVYVQRGVQVGDLTYMHFVLSTTKLDSWRFHHRLSSLTSAKGTRGSRQHVGGFACKDSVVALKGFEAGVLVCSRSHRKLEGLYDITVRVSSLNSGSKGFASHLDMYGLEFEAGMKFVQRYIEAMEWRP